MSSYLKTRNIHYFFKSRHLLKNKESVEQKSEDSYQVKLKVDRSHKYILSLGPLDRKNYLLSLNISKRFKSPHHYSSSVYLLENYVVRKNLKSNTMGYFLFNNEISALKKLQPYKYFPKLLGYDSRRMSIFMTFCGEQITSKNIPDNWEEQINEIEKILNIVNVNSNDMILRNVCVLNKVIYIIDFGLYSQFSESIQETVSKLRYDLGKIFKKKKNFL